MDAGPKTSPAHAAMASALPLRILVVDDHAIVRDGLKQILADKFPHTVFGEARNGQEALDLLAKEQWDVVLLDLSMPGRGGLDVLSEIRTVQPQTKALVLTMHPEDQCAVRVLRSGASGYLTKQSASEELVNAVLKVLNGGKYLSASLSAVLAATLCAEPEQAPHETLSDREYQVMRLLATGNSVKEIALELSLSVKTISTYRTRVLKKLNFKTNADLIRYAMREKLVD